ncbi:MAG: hypothetical protein ACE5GE_04780, partial [Phycisphaerae bacterium]
MQHSSRINRLGLALLAAACLTGPALGAENVLVVPHNQFGQLSRAQAWDSTTSQWIEMSSTLSNAQVEASADGFVIAGATSGGVSVRGWQQGDLAWASGFASTGVGSAISQILTAGNNILVVPQNQFGQVTLAQVWDSSTSQWIELNSTLSNA